MTEFKHSDWSIRVVRSFNLVFLQGTSGFERHIDNSIGLAKYLAGKIKEREGFELVVEVRGFLRGHIYISQSLTYHIISNNSYTPLFQQKMLISVL